MKILLNDLLQFSPSELPDVRIKFNIYNGYEDPLELYQEDHDKVNVEWFLWHDERRYFHAGQTAICFLRIGADIWLLTTIKRITRELPVTGGVGYSADEVEKFQKYFGRVVVKYHNTNKGMGRIYASVMDELEVLEILNDQYTGNGFPGCPIGSYRRCWTGSSLIGSPPCKTRRQSTSSPIPGRESYMWALPQPNTECSFSAGPAMCAAAMAATRA